MHRATARLHAATLHGCTPRRCDAALLNTATLQCCHAARCDAAVLHGCIAARPHSVCRTAPAARSTAASPLVSTALAPGNALPGLCQQHPHRCQDPRGPRLCQPLLPAPGSWEPRPRGSSAAPWAVFLPLRCRCWGTAELCPWSLPQSRTNRFRAP